MQQLPIEEKLRIAMNAVGTLMPDQRDDIVKATVDALAPKGWLASGAIRNGLVAAVTGLLAVLAEVMHYYATGNINSEVLLGGAIGLITGIGAIRGRANATQPIDKGKLL